MLCLCIPLVYKKWLLTLKIHILKEKYSSHFRLGRNMVRTIVFTHQTMHSMSMSVSNWSWVFYLQTMIKNIIVLSISTVIKATNQGINLKRTWTIRYSRIIVIFVIYTQIVYEPNVNFFSTEIFF